MEYGWLSFRDSEKNLNLGCCIISDVQSLGEAIQKSHELEINPGGEVCGVPMNQEGVNAEGLEVDKLYTRQELLNLDYKFM